MFLGQQMYLALQNEQCHLSPVLARVGQGENMPGMKDGVVLLCVACFVVSETFCVDHTSY